MQVVGGKTVVALRLARELASIPSEFPDDLRAEIAKSLLAGDFSLAKSAMHELVLSDPHAAHEAAQWLQAAPSLSNQYDFILSGPSEAEARSPITFLRWLLPVLLALGLLSFNLIPERSGSWQEREDRAARTRAFLITESLVRRYCAEDSTRQEATAYCQAAEAFLREHKLGNCTSSHASLRRLAEVIGTIEYTPDFIAKSVSQFELAYLAQCSESQTLVAPEVKK